MSEDIGALVETLGKGFEEFKATNEARIKELEKKGSADVLTEEKLKRIDDALHIASEAKELVERKMQSRIDAMEAKMNRAMFGDAAEGSKKADAELRVFNAEVKSLWVSRGKVVAPMQHDEYAEYKAAYNSYLRTGRDALSAAELKALSVSLDTEGGYLAPADMSGKIVARAFETSPMREYAAVQVVSSSALEGIHDLQRGVSGGWVSEKAARAETNTPLLGKWRIDVHEQYANPASTQAMLDDGIVDVEAWLAGKITEIMGATENTAFVTGSGVGRPRGFTDYTTAATADASRAWGTLEHINTGLNGGFLTTSAGPDCLLDLIGAFKPTYINANTAWYGNRAAITALRKIKDQQGLYMWQPGLQAGQPQLLLTFPVRMMQDMPALATGSLSLALGDMSKAYQIVQRAGISTLRDPYSNKPYVHFYSVARVGGGVVDFDALKFIRFSA